MLDGKYQRGFSLERLTATSEAKVRKDERGYYIMSLSENTKVYFEDYYGFLRTTYNKASLERLSLDEKIRTTSAAKSETVAYYRARAVIIDLLMRSIRRFYMDGSNFGVIMTPWCFGTVVLEKVEVYRERLIKGEVHDANIDAYPYYIIKYIDEIYKTALLELFDFPDNAFQMRWQYSELLKRYSKILTDITGRLQSVLTTVKQFGS
ncbi:MAG: hypothetical protein SGI97_08270 [candidate division Zixibacteria bacterium]|nr:hypothetical protein [candidate division Zixibacteria bacterium]